MRTYILLLTVCFGLTISAQEVQLSWKKDYNIATELAKAESKPILVYFTKNDCESCMQFYTDFFKQDNFKNLTNDFVFLMLDGSNNDIKSTDFTVIKQRRLVMHHNKSMTFPSVLVLDSDGMQLGEQLLTTDKTSIDSFLNFLETLK